MMRQKQPAAMAAMGVNRTAERRADQMADLTETVHATAQRLIELTELVGVLQDRIVVLEAKA